MPFAKCWKSCTSYRRCCCCSTQLGVLIFGLVNAVSWSFCVYSESFDAFHVSLSWMLGISGLFGICSGTAGCIGAITKTPPLIFAAWALLLLECLFQVLSLIGLVVQSLEGDPYVLASLTFLLIASPPLMYYVTAAHLSLFCQLRKEQKSLEQGERQPLQRA